MIKERSTHFIYLVFFVIAALLLWSWNANSAYADVVSPQLSIAGNGQTMIKGATVVSMEGTTIVLSTTWGATKLTWTVETTGSTKFYPAGPSREMLKALRPGDVLNVTGVLDPQTSRSAIRASVVRNRSLAERLAPAPEGPTERGVDDAENTSAATPPTYPVQEGAKDSLLVAATSTGLLSWLWRFLYGDPATLALELS